ncbi:unnamed protein product [Gadus morhua 'NCC']
MQARRAKVKLGSPAVQETDWLCNAPPTSLPLHPGRLLVHRGNPPSQTSHRNRSPRPSINNHWDFMVEGPEIKGGSTRRAGRGSPAERWRTGSGLLKQLIPPQGRGMQTALLKRETPASIPGID